MESIIMTRSVYVVKEEEWFVAQDIVSGIASQGKSVPEALANLREALVLYYQDVSPEEPAEHEVYFTTIEVPV